MSDVNPRVAEAALDIGEYCRRVEQHLTKVNAGHLVRIVGPGFALVRGWALSGVPLSIVLHGITLKAERHHAGARAARPLRLEFCESDVRAVFEQWQRAVGLPVQLPAAPGAPSPSSGGLADPAVTGEAAASAEAGESGGAADERRPASLSKHLDRAADRLSRAAGRLDLPEASRDAISRLLDDVIALRDQARKARGQLRDGIAAHLPSLDRAVATVARAAVTPTDLVALEADAAADLAPYRARLDPATWRRSVDVTIDRLLRDKLGLPMLTLP